MCPECKTLASGGLYKYSEVFLMNKNKAELSQSQPISLNKLGMCWTLQDDDEQAVWACPECWQIN